MDASQIKMVISAIPAFEMPVGKTENAHPAFEMPIGRTARGHPVFQMPVGKRNTRKKEMVNRPADVVKLELTTKRDGNNYILDGADTDSITVSQSIKATISPKPEYPPNAKANGAVNVEVTLDATGNVVSAKAISGDKAFYQTSETAAKTAKFEIPKLSVEIAKITGVMVYDFAAKNKTVSAATELQNVRVEIKPNKYHSAVRALVGRLKNNTAATADEAKFVKDGKAEIIVRVKELKPETIAELKKLGFEVLTEMTSANAVVGRIAVEKIAALAEIDAVTFISPQNR